MEEYNILIIYKQVRKTKKRSVQTAMLHFSSKTPFKRTINVMQA